LGGVIPKSGQGKRNLINRKTPRFTATLIFIALTLLSNSQCYSKEDENSPIIHIDQTQYTFPSALVGGASLQAGKGKSL